MGIVSKFPSSWKETVTVLRGGGRDRNGDIQPEQEIPVAECLIGQRTTAEPNERIENAVAGLSLYRDPDPSFFFQSTDRIRRANGDVYQVGGKPAIYPIGVEITLEEI